MLDRDVRLERAVSIHNVLVDSASDRVMTIRVECYAGHRGEETPRALIIGARRVQVADVLDQWLGPDHRYFKLRGVDGDTYLVRHDVESGNWELTLFRRRIAEPASR